MPTQFEHQAQGNFICCGKEGDQSRGWQRLFRGWQLPLLKGRGPLRDLRSSKPYICIIKESYSYILQPPSP